MSFFTSLFSATSSKKSTDATIQKRLLKLKIDCDEPLPACYMQSVMGLTSKKISLRQLFHHLLLSIQTNNSGPAVIKLFTIVFRLLRKNGYPEYLIEELQCLQDLKSSNEFESQTSLWAKELVLCCFTYLGRIPSLKDVYKRALSYKTKIIGDQTMKLDLFRLVNAYSLLFPGLNKATCWVGRYYRKTFLFYSQFYKTLRSQIALGYTYMKYICKRFMHEYQRVDVETLNVFNEIIPEIELLCDQIEEFTLSKYYREESLGRKLYFKEEEIQEMSYYLTLNTKCDKKYEEMVRTSDTETFGVMKSL